MICKNGAAPPAIVSKAREWVRYWMQSQTAYLLEYWQRLYGPAYCCNVFIVWTDWTDPTCFPEDTSSPAHNGHAPYGHWVGCETQATGRYYPGWNPPVDYNSGVIHIDLPYDVFAPCPAGTEFGGPNPTDCRPVCPAGTTRDAATGECKAGCPVGALTDFPPAGDLCSASLEAGNGNDVNNACPASSVMSDPKGEPCLAQKLGVLGIPYAGPTSTIRTAAYQQHLGEVFDKFWQHQWLITDPVAYQACTTKRAVVEGEMSKHGIDYAPAPNDSRHLDGMAFDISRTTVGLMGNVPAMLRTAPACNLKWGGMFPEPDRVHFYTP